MKLAVAVLSLFLGLSSSQASTSAPTQDPESRKLSVSKIQTPTKSVRVLAARKHQRRHIISNDLSDGDDGPPTADELDMQSPYRRPELVKNPKQPDDDDDDYVTVRLAVARARAMAAYREKWG